MNKYLKIVLPALLILFAAGIVSAQKTPENTARNFYAWYMKGLQNSGYPIDKKTEMKKYISRRLANWVYSKSYQEYGADYFIDAQDFEDKWQPTVSKAVIKGNTANLKVTLDVPKGVKTEWKKSVLPVKLIKENGVWKIDEINNRKLIK